MIGLSKKRTICCHWLRSGRKEVDWKRALARPFLKFDFFMLQLQQLGLPSGFRSRVQWLDNIYLTTIQYETKHPGRNHYAKNEHNR